MTATPFSHGGGFRRVGEEELLRLWVHTVVRGEFEGPDGERFQRSYLRTMDAVGIVPVDGDEVVLVRQYRAAVDRTVLEIPAGMCDVDGEAGEATANRELVEEAGFRAGRVEHLCTFLNMCGMSDHATSIYLGRDLEATPIERHGVEEEHMTIERVQLADAPKLIASGEIQDAKTVIGLLLAHARLLG